MAASVAVLQSRFVFWSFSFQGSFVWADRIYVATVWSHGQCFSIDDFHFIITGVALLGLLKVVYQVC